MAATLNLTQEQTFTALRAFLLYVLPTGIPVDQAQDNYVPEPSASDFVLMTPLRQERLSWNETTYQDNVFTGAIADTVLTVSAIAQSEGGILPGMLLTDGTWPFTIAANTTVVNQLSGTPGGIGTYTVTPSQILASETIYAGARSDLVPTRFVVQLDVHGPNSGNYVKTIEGLFFSSVATDFFTAEGYPVQALHASEGRQLTFIDAESQYEERWTMEVHLQTDPVLGTPIQFADQVAVHTVEAATQYTGP